MENPQTGLLKEREVVAGLAYVDVTYCSCGYPYKKPTRIWCCDPSLFRLPPPLFRRHPRRRVPAGEAAQPERSEGALQAGWGEAGEGGRLLA